MNRNTTKKTKDLDGWRLFRWVVDGFVATKVPSKNGTVQGALVEGCASQDDIATAAWSRLGTLEMTNFLNIHLVAIVAKGPMNQVFAHGATVSSANCFWSRKAKLYRLMQNDFLCISEHMIHPFFTMRFLIVSWCFMYAVCNVFFFHIGVQITTTLLDVSAWWNFAQPDIWWNLMFFNLAWPLRMAGSRMDA